MLFVCVNIAEAFEELATHCVAFISFVVYSFLQCQTPRPGLPSHLPILDGWCAVVSSQCKESLMSQYVLCMYVVIMRSRVMIGDNQHQNYLLDTVQVHIISRDVTKYLSFNFARRDNGFMVQLKLKLQRILIPSNSSMLLRQSLQSVCSSVCGSWNLCFSKPWSIDRQSLNARYVTCLLSLHQISVPVYVLWCTHHEICMFRYILDAQV